MAAAGARLASTRIADEGSKWSGRDGWYQSQRSLEGTGPGARPAALSPQLHPTRLSVPCSRARRHPPRRAAAGEHRPSAQPRRHPPRRAAAGEHRRAHRRVSARMWSKNADVPAARRPLLAGHRLLLAAPESLPSLPARGRRNAHARGAKREGAEASTEPRTRGHNHTHKTTRRRKRVAQDWDHACLPRKHTPTPHAREHTRAGMARIRTCANWLPEYVCGMACRNIAGHEASRQ